MLGGREGMLAELWSSVSQFLLYLLFNLPADDALSYCGLLYVSMVIVQPFFLRG